MTPSSGVLQALGVSALQWTDEEVTIDPRRATYYRCRLIGSGGQWLEPEAHGDLGKAVGGGLPGDSVRTEKARSTPSLALYPNLFSPEPTVACRLAGGCVTRMGLSKVVGEPLA